VQVFDLDLAGYAIRDAHASDGPPWPEYRLCFGPVSDDVFSALADVERSYSTVRLVVGDQDVVIDLVTIDPLENQWVRLRGRSAFALRFDSRPVNAALVSPPLSCSRAQGSAVARREAARYMLSGLLKCACCGSKAIRCATIETTAGAGYVRGLDCTQGRVLGRVTPRSSFWPASKPSWHCRSVSR